MNNLETLKQELLSQKELIEKGGGTVIVAGTNPSPAEITEGIKTIAGADLSVATATEEDVKSGKTFFAGSSTLRTGTANMDTESIHHIFMFNQNSQTSQESYYYTCPDHLSVIRASCFELNLNIVTITLNENITKIGQYAFYGTKNFSFTNFADLSKLTYVGQSSFRGSGCGGVDFANLPNSLLTIEDYAFENVLKENQSLKIPTSLTRLGTSAFKQSSRVKLYNFDASSNTSITSFGNSSCYFLAFDCDFMVPSNVKLIGSQFNYNGCFKNIILHSNIQLSSSAFGASTSRPLSEFYLESVVFEGETPPSVGSSVFAEQNITNGFKIYVPDNSVEAYKAVTNLAKYVDCIYPISQKE